MKKPLLAITVGIACGLAVPGSVSAQELGERVRVTLLSERFVGVVSEAGQAEIVLALVGDDDGGLRTVTRDEIQRLERSLGRQRRGMGKWALYGSAGGAGLGALSGAGLFGEVTCGGNFFRRGRVCSGETETIIALAFGYGLAGALAGGLYGGLAKSEAWEMVDASGLAGLMPRLLYDTRTGSVGVVVRLSL